MAMMIIEKKRKRNELKMNFSVGVNMYRENVTSYWYLFRWSHRNVDANIDIFYKRRESIALETFKICRADLDDLRSE